MKFLALATTVLMVFPELTSAQVIDCSEAYANAPATCQPTACDPKYNEFIGTWTGPFLEYVQALSSKGNKVYRPFQNTITYSAADCLQNIETGETFIIGRRTDEYPAFQGLPAKTVPGLLITGKDSQKNPFLRTVDRENGLVNYRHDYENKAANLSIWSLVVPASNQGPEMTFVTTDGRDQRAAIVSNGQIHKRDVTVTLTVGPRDKPYEELVIVSGFHTLMK